MPKLAIFRGHGAPPPPGPPLVGPSLSWTGVAGSGGAAPSTIPRTTAQVAANWFTPPNQKFAVNSVIGVAADCGGLFGSGQTGVAYVEFWVEGTVQRVTETVYIDTDVNGNTRSRQGFWITLNAAAAVAAHPTGTVSIYATAMPNDTNVQGILLGPANFYTRPTAYSVGAVKKVPTDYATLRLAIDTLSAAVHAGTYENWSIELETAGPHEGGFPTQTYNNYGFSIGFSKIFASPGIAATIRRGSSFDPYNTDAGGGNIAWAWYVGASNVEFGPGIEIDMHNFISIRSDKNWADHGAAWYFNGCKITNSAGTAATLYWNKDDHPVLSYTDVNGADIRTYAESITLEYQNGGPTNWMTNCFLKEGVSGPFGNPSFVEGCYTNGYTASFFFLNSIPSIRIGYSGGAMTAWIIKDFVSNGVGSLYLYTGGTGRSSPVLVKRYDFTKSPTVTPGAGGLWFNISDIVNDLNTNYGAAGWTATLLDDTRNTTGLGGSASIFDESVKSTTYDIPTSFDIHCEWVHYLGSIQNSLVRKNVDRDSRYSSNWFNQEAKQDGLDIIVRDNIWFNNSGGPVGTSSALGHHFVFTGNVLDGGITVYNGFNDAYCLFSNNFIGGGGIDNSGGWDPLMPCINNGSLNSTLPSGTNDSGNFTIVDNTQFQAAFTNVTIGDFRPDDSGTIVSHLKARLTLYDGRNNARASADAVGAWAVGYGPPVYPS